MRDKRVFEGRGEGGVVAHNWCSMTVFCVEKVGGRGRGMDEARDRGLEKVGRRERVNADDIGGKRAGEKEWGSEERMNSI